MSPSDIVALARQAFGRDLQAPPPLTLRGAPVPATGTFSLVVDFPHAFG